MKNMVETTAGPNLVMKAVFAICAFILTIVLLPAGTAHAATTPIIDEGTKWYTSSTAKSAYTTINIVDSYAPTGSEKESWDASSANDGSVMAYVSADGATLTLAGNGSGFLKANANSSGLFEEFSSVTTINGLSLLDTSGVIVLSGVFEHDASLTSVEGIENWDVSKVERFEAFFNECENLTSIDLSKWDVSSAQVMSSFFSHCINLTNLKVPTTRAVDLYHIADAFHHCLKLESVDISFMNSGKISYAVGLFQDAESLKSVTGYETLITSEASEIDYIFSGCSSLEYLDVSQWDVSGATSLIGLFSYMYDITAIDGLENWDVSNAEDLSRLFLQSSVTNLDGICGWDVSNVVSFEKTFGMTDIASLDLSAWNTGSAEDMSSMFDLCLELEELKFGPTFTTANVENFAMMLKDCDSISELDISMFDTSAATDMTDLFDGMDTLQVITLGKSFSFTGNGSASCVLPTPDPEYIPSATGNWQAVAGGTVDEPAGTVYAPADVPSNVAETYVMEVQKVPILAETNSWYKGTALKSTYTTINIVDSYAPVGSEKESWDASATQDGSVMAHVSADGKTLTIAGNGSGYVKANVDSTYAFLEFSSATAINGIDLLDVSETESMKWMFKRCNALTSLNLDDWDVSNVTNMDAIFNECESLTSFGSTALGNWETGKVTNMSHAFKDCGSLETLDVSDWDTSSCTDMSWMFYECEGLNTLDVSGFDTSKVEDFEAIFYGCSNLEVIDASKWNTGNATDFSFMFNKCEKVKELDVSSFDTSKATDMSVMFANCEAVTTLDLSNFNTSDVVDMNFMFSGSTALASVDLSSFDTSKCMDFEQMFYNCSSLKALDIGNFDTASATSMENMFGKMVRLQQITLGEKFSFTGDGTATDCVLPTPDPTYFPGTTGKWQAVASGTVDTPKGTVYLPADVPNNVDETYVVHYQGDPILAAGSSWYKADALRNTIVTINVVDSYTPTGSEKESWDASAAGDGSVMAYILADGTTLVIAGNGSGVVYANADSSCAFGNIDNYTSNGNEFTALVTFNGADTLDMSKVTNATRMFYYAQKLQALDVSSWDVSNVVTFDSTFAECRVFTTLDVSSWDISSAESLHNLFGQCRALTTLDVSNWDTAGVKDMGSMFEFCRALPSLDVSGFDTSSCTDTSGMFYACTSLGNIDMSGWDTSKVTDMSAMFASCAKFTKLDVTGFDTSNVKDFSFMFQSLLSLSTLDVSGFDTSSAVDMGNMFAQSSRLSYLDVTGFDTSKVEDFNGMFNDCGSLASIDVTGFDTTNATDFDSMFMNCTNLKTLDLSSFDTSKAEDMKNFFYRMFRLQQVTLGEKFGFTGNGSTSCVLPTPDPAYITGAIGKWQAVANGTVTKPAGTVYLPDDVPSNVKETYVMPPTIISVDVPVKVTLAASADGTWCTPTATANQIINHSMAPVNVLSAEASSADGFTMLANASVASSTASNVFGGTITAGSDAAQDLTAINTSAGAWTMEAETDSDDSDLISLQLVGSIGNVEGTYFTEATQLFDISYTFELAL